MLRNTHAEDIEDAYDPNGTSTAHTMYLDHVEARYIRDDCIEDEGTGTSEKPMNVVINNSLFDGCFTGFAERPTWSNSASQNGSGAQSLTVDNSLMYIQPQPLGPNYCSSSKVSSGRCKPTGTSNVWLGAHGIWKWSAAAAKNVTIRNTIFRLDQASYSSCASQQWPAGTYQNVKLVWTGSGSYATAPGCDACRGSGRLDRVRVLEYLPLDSQDLRRPGRRAALRDRQAEARQPTLLDAVLSEAADGRVDVREVLRLLVHEPR